MGKLAIGDLDPPDVLEAKAWQLSFLLARINRNRSAALACSLILGLVSAAASEPRKACPVQEFARPTTGQGDKRAPIQAPQSVPESAPKNLFLVAHFPHLSEARAYWQFGNYWSAQATASGKPLVRINMDETCVCLVQSPLRGVVLRAVGGRGARRPPRFRASRNQQRTNLTYVAFVTDCAALQAQLPQFIIGSRRACFPPRGFDELFNASPTSVFLMQGDLLDHLGPRGDNDSGGRGGVPTCLA